MYEILFIGRGGQGAKTAAEIVARIAMKKGLHIQSFPDYGPERKGAPVRAFTRTSNEPIRGCSNEANPDVIVIIDPTLISLEGTLFNTREEQTIIINSSKNIKLKGKTYSVNANSIAMELLKATITNTTMLGALSKTTGYYTLEELEEEIKEEFSRKLSPEVLQKNLEAAKRAYDEVKEC
ncbi:MAG: 2-oxoacid:acceptor oxidoreductase family protein [Candidatus Woesearchaeota archaeon]